MPKQQADPYAAAVHLIALIKAPAGSIDISTFKKADEDTSLRVFLRPEFSYLQGRIPDMWEGFKVTCEVASKPKARA